MPIGITPKSDKSSTKEARIEDTHILSCFVTKLGLDLPITRLGDLLNLPSTWCGYPLANDQSASGVCIVDFLSTPSYRTLFLLETLQCIVTLFQLLTKLQSIAGLSTIHL